MEKDIEHFRKLSRGKILKLQPEAWGNYELLEVAEYFSDKGEQDKEAAVIELILCSPENNETVDYAELYTHLVEYYCRKKDYSPALKWALAIISYEEQHGVYELNRANNNRTLAEIYLHSGDLNSGLALFARQLELDTEDIYTYNALGFVLQAAGLNDLLVEVMEHALNLLDEDKEGLLEQFTDFLRDAVEKSKKGKSKLRKVDPKVLENFRRALDLPISERSKVQQESVYQPPMDRLIQIQGEDTDLLHAKILANGKVLLPDLIRLVFDRNIPESHPAMRALHLLRELRDRQIPELEALSNLVNRNVENWRDELLTSKFGKIGGYTTNEIKAFAVNPDFFIFLRVTALEALAERAGILPKQRDDIVDFMHQMLTRPEVDSATEETISGFVVVNIMDLNARKLYPDIKKAFENEMINPIIIGLDDVQKEWGMPRDAPHEISENEFRLLLK